MDKISKSIVESIKKSNESKVPEEEDLQEASKMANAYKDGLRSINTTIRMAQVAVDKELGEPGEQKKYNAHFQKILKAVKKP